MTNHNKIWKENFSKAAPSLRKWFLNQKRDLPWRQDPSPYAVWISEVMLQQTQVAVVIPYFYRWMERFPTIHDLAKASLDDVIKLWEGLGYYSRARNLHQGAQYIVENYAGNLPRSAAELRKIKGLGPYTVGAIRSFAFKERAAVVDGNVTRVLARFFAISDDIAKPKTTRRLWEIAEVILPDQQPWVVNEALIELGATICQRKANCLQCPINHQCASFAQGITKEIPFKSKTYKAELLHRAIAVISSGNYLLVKRGAAGAIMSDLHEFPYFECNDKKMLPKQMIEHFEEQWSLKMPLRHSHSLEKVSHSFTRFNATLYPFVFSTSSRPIVEGCKWLTVDELDQLAFSSGHRRIFEDWKQTVRA